MNRRREKAWKEKFDNHIDVEEIDSEEHMFSVENTRHFVSPTNHRLCLLEL